MGMEGSGGGECGMRQTTFHRLCGVCLGEFMGTFLLVFMGTSAVTVSALFKAHAGLLQVAIVWGLGVTLAIYATRHLSCAHLNPAVSLGMAIAGRMNVKLLPWYFSSQMVGAFAAGAAVLLLFGGAIGQFEAALGITRGTPDSVITAMMFGEYFPNPGFAGAGLKVGMATAMLAEGLGTFILVSMIFALTEGCNVGRPSDTVAPLFIGATVTAIIAVIAPLTQAGINPARDLGPRLVCWLAGWGEIAIPGPYGGFFSVYILSPMLGGSMAALGFRFMIEPMMAGRRNNIPESSCGCAAEKTSA